MTRCRRRDARRERLAGPIGVLRGWDYRWSAESVAQSLAMFWGDELMKARRRAGGTSRSTSRPLGWPATRAMRRSSPRSTTRSRGCGATSAGGRCRGARSTASSASRRRSTIRSAMPRRASRSPSPRRAGARSPRSARRPKPGTKKLVRHQRQQLRRGRRVREAGPRAGRHGRRRERQSRLAAFQRPGRALRDRQAARGLFLSRPAEAATPSGATGRANS